MASLATCATWVCPRKSRRWPRPADHRSGQAASCAAGTVSRPTRRRRRRPRRRHGGHPRPTAPLAVLRRRGTGLYREGKPVARGLGSRRNPALAGPPGTPSGPSVTSLPPRSTRPQGFHPTYGHLPVTIPTSLFAKLVQVLGDLILACTIGALRVRRSSTFGKSST